ncbi:MAG: pilus assembly protein TadG-related protein, partial [Candidatus Brocadiia bacterium]|nr:pilus assembly protein TadG-related protein [Candidatus Brocadiia bacterium]
MASPAQLTRNRRTGAKAFVLFVARMVVVAAACVFAIDVGLISASRARLQNAADADALAATQKLIEVRNTGAEEEAARYATSQEAQDMVAANWDEAGWQVAFGGYSGGPFIEHGDATPATAGQAITTRDEGAPGGALGLVLGPVLGFEAVDISTTGGCKVSAGIRLMRGTGNLLPFGVDEAVVAPPGETMIICDTCKNTPGNFGLLDFDGGSNGAN